MSMTLIKKLDLPVKGTLTSVSPAPFDVVSGSLFLGGYGPSGAGTCDARGGDSTFGQINFSVQPRTFIGAWIMIKSQEVQGTNSQFIIRTDSGMHLASNSGGIIAISEFIWNAPLTGIVPDFQWVFFGMAASLVSGTSFDLKFWYKTLTGPFTVWASNANDNIFAPISAAKFGRCQTGLQYPNVEFAFGSPCVYTYDNNDFSDIVYPAEIVSPPSRGDYYVNPAIGNDANDGITPATAWKSAAQINAVTAHTGILLSISYATGSSLVIDTGQGSLDLSVPLSLGVRGLNVRAAVGQSWIVIKPYKTLAPGGWTSVGSGVYSTTDTIALCCVWENDQWLNHPNGANYAAVSAALASTPGSFWTDGTTLYLHPFGNTDPRSDGKTYTRSHVGFAFPAVQLAAAHLSIQNLYVQKTCDVNASDGTPNGGYGIGSMPGYGGNTLIKDCYCDYGGKHCFGLADDATNADVTIDNLRVEQGSPYAAFGGQSPLVSYINNGTGNIHRYLRCRCDKPSGAIGSTTGGAFAAYPVFINHGGAANNFAEIQFINCLFSQGWLVDYGVSQLLTITGTTFGLYETNTPVVNVNRCRIDFRAVTLNGSATLVMRNCIVTPMSPLQAGGFVGFGLRNIVEMSNNVFDLSGIPSTDNPNRGFLDRQAALNLTFRNNVVIIPSGKDYTILNNGVNTDTLNFTKNAYTLGAQLKVAWQYNDGTTTADRTLAQWQALGKDAGSFNSAALGLSGYKPAQGSPVIDAGINLGPLEDYTGKVFNPRNDIGAYEYFLVPVPSAAISGTGTYDLLYAIAQNTAGTPPKFGDGIYDLVWKFAQNTAGTPPRPGDRMYDLYYKIAQNTAGVAPPRFGDRTYDLLCKIARNTGSTTVRGGTYDVLCQIAGNTAK
jgi:hypothetical protein